jgi:hypothetical protein
MPHEKHYYTTRGAGRLTLPPVCSWCSETSEEAFIERAELERKEGKKMHPLCQVCNERGFEPQFFGKTDQTAKGKSKSKQRRHCGGSDDEAGEADEAGEDSDGGGGGEEEGEDMELSDDGSGDDAIDWLNAALVQSPAVLREAISRRYAPRLWKEEQGWDEDCGNCDSTGEALECSFCSHVFHNTTECIGADIASPESLAHGAHWACSGCWKEMREAAERKLLAPALQPKKKRARRAKA